MWIEQNFFKYIIAFILVLLSILLLYHNIPIFYEFFLYLAAFVLPLLFSTILYYVLRPLVNLLTRWMPRHWAILYVYVLVAVVFTVAVLLFIPEVVSSANYFSQDQAKSLKDKVAHLISTFESYTHLPQLSFFEDLIYKSLSSITGYTSTMFVAFIKAFAGLAVAIGLTPFILFYFLRDDALFSRFIMRYVPLNHQQEVQNILTDVDASLGGFIFSRVIVASILGLILLLGYALIGLPFPFLLAFFAAVLSVIPVLGTFIGLAPAILFAATIDVYMIVKVLILTLIAHLIENYVITPRLMASTLKIHPLTIILLLLLGSYIFGVLGLILIIPAYAIIKVFVWNIYKIVRLRTETAKLQTMREAAKQEKLDENTAAE